MRTSPGTDDDALDLFALLVATWLINPARTVSADERLASLPRLEQTSRLLVVAVNCARPWTRLHKMGPGWTQLRSGRCSSKVGSREQLVGAAVVLEELVPEHDGSAESAMRVVPGERYRAVRPFLGLLDGSGSLAAATVAGRSCPRRRRCRIWQHRR